MLVSLRPSGLADDPKHPRQVAITVFDAGYAEVLGKDRFLREIEVTAGLRFLESLRGDAEYEALISGLTHDGCEGIYAGSVRFYRGGRR